PVAAALPYTTLFRSDRRAHGLPRPGRPPPVPVARTRARDRGNARRRPPCPGRQAVAPALRVARPAARACGAGWAASVVLVRRGREQLLAGAGQRRVAFERGLAQGHGRCVQQPVGEGVGEELEHFGRGVAGGELLLRLCQDFVAGALAVRAQALDRLDPAAGLLRLDIARDLQVDDGFGGLRRFAPASAIVLDRAL